MRITSDDLNAFFREKKSGDKCVFCQTEIWLLFSDKIDDDDTPATLPHDEDLAPLVTRTQLSAIDKTPSEQVLVSLPMFCGNCGFIRQINWPSVLEWMKSRKDVVDGEGQE